MGQEAFRQWMDPWKDWVEKRLEIWNCLTITSLLIRDESHWWNAGTTIVLDDDQEPIRARLGHEETLLTERALIVQRTRPLDELGSLLLGLEQGFWEVRTLPGVEHKIVFNVGIQLAPSGSARLELPPRSGTTENKRKPWALWPHYGLQLASGSLEKQFPVFPFFEDLNDAVRASGFGSFGEIADRFGLRDYAQDAGSFRRLSTGVSLIAPLRARAVGVRWLEDDMSLECDLRLGRLVPPDRIRLVIQQKEATERFVPFQPQKAGWVKLWGRRPEGQSSLLVIADKLAVIQDMEIRLEEQHTKRGLRVYQPRVDSGPNGWGIIRPLGAGGQGTVSLVEKEGSLGALKEFKTESINRSIRGRRFRNEIRLLDELTRAGVRGIVKLLDGSPPDTELPPWLVTEFAQLGTAESHIAFFKGDIQATLRLGQTVAEALSTLHARRLFHRDVKPANILLRQLTEPVLADLGLAFAEDDDDERVTSLGDRLRTKGFSPPEADTGEKPDPTWDIFMLGRTIKWLLMGPPRALADGPGSEASVAYFQNPLFQPLDELIDEMCQIEKKLRISSMEAVVFRLRALTSS